MPGGLLFRWERPRQRKVAIAGFLLASAALHALCFYLFQVVYPPAISLLPPPAQVSLIAPTSDDARAFLNWLDAEDPALATRTERPADARAFQLPKLAHIPSYLAVPPKLKELPARGSSHAAPSAMPPAPVPVAPAANSAPPVLASTVLIFSDELGELPVTRPESKFQASLRARRPGKRALSPRRRFARRCALQLFRTILRRRRVGRAGSPLPCPLPLRKGGASSFGRRANLGDSHVRIWNGSQDAAERGGARAVIRVSLAALVTIYLLLFLAAVFLLWIFGEWNRRRREQRALRHRLRCVICAFEFEDRTPTLLPRCPRCGSLNERFKLDRI